MKVGDKVPVTLQGYDVAEATIVEIDAETDEVYLEFPATRVVMGRTSGLGDLNRTPEKDRILSGLQEGGTDVYSDAQDEVRAAYEAEGIELDEEPDEVSTTRRIAPQGSQGGREPVGSLREMELDGLD